MRAVRTPASQKRSSARRFPSPPFHESPPTSRVTATSTAMIAAVAIPMMIVTAAILEVKALLLLVWETIVVRMVLEAYSPVTASAPRTMAKI